MSLRVLIVDDEPQMCESLVKLFKREGIDAMATTQPAQAIEILQTKPPDILIMDIKMPRIDGLALLQRVRKRFQNLPVIMISGIASIDNAVKAMRIGARNFYQKPIHFSELLCEVQAIEGHTTQQQLIDRQFVSEDPGIAQILAQVTKIADTDVAVLITGESGTGKELIATSIHESSQRRDLPFVKVNCAAIPETLLESELFGHERGAFTDAKISRKGRFETAGEGSLFFDEIGEMSPSTQAKLLRVLQEREYHRLGSDTQRLTRARIIAATNKDIHQMIGTGQFRDDLYYRLSVVHIELPPLRQRPIDIPVLAQHFLNRFAKTYQKDITGFDDKVMHAFLAHDWPGNVRELRNTIERAVIFADSTFVSEHDLPSQYRYGSEPLSRQMEEMHNSITREMILSALEQTNGIKSEAADLLHIHRKTLYNKMKRLGLHV